MAYPPNPYHPQAFGPSHTPSPPSAYPPQPQTGGHTAFSQTGGHAAFSQTGGHVAFPQTGGHAAFPQTDTNPFRDEPSLKELEAQYIRYLLTSHHGNRSACARVLGIGRNTLLRKMKEYGIE
jgi:DNA-binding NtrC family response regulator